ncbi:MAG: hypothetical protein J6B43_08975, partial [Lachnospiraceae bacterium]|nr:hypothetical protein [Lachnospiraceae bacterium]
YSGQRWHVRCRSISFFNLSSILFTDSNIQRKCKAHAFACDDEREGGVEIMQSHLRELSGSMLAMISPSLTMAILKLPQLMERSVTSIRKVTSSLDFFIY